MTSDAPALSLADDLLARASEDWVSPAEVIDLARRSGAENPEDLRDLSVGLISRLILAGLLVPGEIDAGGHRAWESSAAASIERIATDWNARTDAFVMPGEIVWLNTTTEGQLRGEQVLRQKLS